MEDAAGWQQDDSGVAAGRRWRWRGGGETEADEAAGLLKNYVNARS